MASHSMQHSLHSNTQTNELVRAVNAKHCKKLQFLISRHTGHISQPIKCWFRPIRRQSMCQFTRKQHSKAVSPIINGPCCVHQTQAVCRAPSRTRAALLVSRSLACLRTGPLTACVSMLQKGCCQCRKASACIKMKTKA